MIDPFSGPGDIRALCRALDWGGSSLGPVGSWPASLRLAVRMCLDARFPMAIWAGPERVLIYNDGYPPVVGPDRHPWALGRSAREVWADLWDRLGPELDAVFAGQSTVHEDERFVLRRHGREDEAYFTYSFTPIPADDGRVVGALNVFVETTERVHALHRGTALLEAISDSTQDAIFAKDLDGRVLFANPATLAVLGLPQEGAVGRVLPGPITDPSLRRWISEGDDDVLATGARVNTEIELAGPPRRVWSTVKSPHRDATGRTIGVLAISRDITDLTRALARLEEQDRRKDEFLAMLSHELRNPLAPIMTSLHILDRVAPDSERAHRANEVLRRQVVQLSHLVDDLLDVTRISRGKIQLRLEQVELRGLVQAATEDQRPLFDRAGVALEVTSGSPALVHADRSRIAQVVGNLLQNAAKFTPRGGHVRVGVSADPAAREATLAVEDDGAGMAPEVLEHLFEPFVQAERTLDRSRGGLGLGLALVKGLVALHGGSVTASSDGIGRGARFEVRLPLQEAQRPVASAEGPAATRAERRRVLLIEDNVDAAASLRELIELFGHEVHVAHSGPEGVAKARETRPEVVLCDLGLPGMDGYAVARALRADATLRDAQLVALSGYAQPEDLRLATEAGFEDHLAKPPDLDALQRILAHAPASTS